MSRLAWTRGGFLHDVLARGTAAHPDAPALVDGDRASTFAELGARVAATAAFVESATRPGARVAFVGENHWSWVDAYYGVPRAGRVLVFCNHRLAAPSDPHGFGMRRREASRWQVRNGYGSAGTLKRA